LCRAERARIIRHMRRWASNLRQESEELQGREREDRELRALTLDMAADTIEANVGPTSIDLISPMLVPTALLREALATLMDERPVMWGLRLADQPSRTYVEFEAWTHDALPIVPNGHRQPRAFDLAPTLRELLTWP